MTRPSSRTMRRSPAASSSWPACVDTSTTRPSSAAARRRSRQPFAAGGVEARARFVEHQDARVGQERERKAEALPHAAGQIADRDGRVAAETRLLEQQLAALRAARAGSPRRTACVSATVRSGCSPPLCGM